MDTVSYNSLYFFLYRGTEIFKAKKVNKDIKSETTTSSNIMIFSCTDLGCMFPLTHLAMDTHRIDLIIFV
jgi:hypothetical protein